MMAQPREPEPVKLIVGMLAFDVSLFADAEVELARHYGEVEAASAAVDFNFTDYYRSTMGEGLKRKFIVFTDLVDPGRLAEIKLLTNRIENEIGSRFTHHDSRMTPLTRRPINLDPGYLCGSRLVLASAKDFAHRIYLSQGIYAEVTLIFRDKSYQPLEWTYPDYRVSEHISFFNEVRRRYLERRRKEQAP